MAKRSKNSIVVDGVSIDKMAIIQHESADAFVKAWSEDKTYGHVFEGPNREAKLREVFAMVQPKEETKALAPAKESKAKG